MANITVRWTLPTRADVETAGRLAISRAALQAISGIQRDTAKGIGSGGGTFVPYTRAYALAKQASGRRIDPPDLTLTGTMLRALRLLRVEGPRRAIIGWEGQHVTRSLLAKSAGAFSMLDSRRTIKKRTTSSRRVRAVAYATLVPALDRRRRFFHLERADRVRQVREVYARTMREGLAAELRRPRTATRL